MLSSCAYGIDLGQDISTDVRSKAEAMEHLVYVPEARSFRREVRAAVRGPLEVVDWEQQDESYGPCPPLSPTVAWLGHDHGSSSCWYEDRDRDRSLTPAQEFEAYGAEWDFQEAMNARDVSLVYPSFKGRDIDAMDIALQAAAFLQSWFYLGVLEAIVGRRISPSFFTRRDILGKTCLYSRKLPVLLSARMTQPDHGRDFLAGMRECTVIASLAFRNCLEDLAKHEDHPPFGRIRQLLISSEPAISALHEALTQWTEFHVANEIKYHHSVVDSGRSELETRFISRGWCPFVVASVERSMSPTVLRQIDALGLTVASSGHHRCTRRRCERNHVQRETYAPQHRPKKCRCAAIKPDLATVLDVIDAGCFPVILFDSAGGTIDVGGIRADETTAAYIAFSHVWADGLGSWTEAGLPLCQVRWLHNLAQSRLATTAAFWIDALCIPRLEPYRHKAISLMKATYQNAQGVVVIDEQLSTLSVGDAPLTTAWFVFASGWFGRLWTYQEGFLPPWVDFMLRDGFLDFTTLIQGLHEMWMNFEGNRFPAMTARELFAVLQKARPIRTKERDRPYLKKVVDLFNAFSRRDSSRLDDQILVVCLLLNINIDHLLHLRPVDRWCALYIALGRIPWTIVFDRRPKIDVKPFRWAPTSWLSSGQDEWLHYKDAGATILQTGLHCEITVLRLFDIMSLPLEGILYVVVDNTYFRVDGLSLNDPTDLSMFDMVIVRHFADEHPEQVLVSNPSVHMRVGLALQSSDVGGDLQYHFHESFSICFVPVDDPGSSELKERRTGYWDQTDVCFT